MEFVADLQRKLQDLLKKRFFRYGVPFLTFVLGGSFGLKEFAKLRYEFSKQSSLKPELAEEYGLSMKKPGEVTLESEFEKIKKLDIDNWSNIRGPRPWEKNEQQRKSTSSSA